MKIKILNKNRPFGSCSRCGGVGGVWVYTNKEKEICPDCLLELGYKKGEIKPLKTRNNTVH